MDWKVMMEKLTGNHIGLVSLLLSIFGFGFMGRPAEMGVAVAGSAIFLAFVNLDKFERFKGAGFEAEMKQVVEDAKVTIEQLNDVVTPVLEFNLVSMATANRFSGPPFSKNHQLFDQMLALQERFCIVKESVEEAKSAYINVHAWDMVTDFLGDFTHLGEKQKLPKFSESKLGKRGFDSAPNFGYLKSSAEQLELSKDISEKLQIIEDYYKKYGLTING